MTSFFFWNVMGRDLRTLVARAAVERSLDIVLIAEAGMGDAEMVAALDAATGWRYVAISQDSDKVRIFTRIAKNQWIRRQTDALSARMAIWSIAVGRPPGILLATTHFLSKNHTTATEQAMLSVELSKEIRIVENFVATTAPFSLVTSI